MTPRWVFISFDYLPIEELLNLIDEPNGSISKRILMENRSLFESIPGSTHNHQAWRGGFLDHLVDGMNYGRHLFTFESGTGRPMPFTLSDALLVFFLHDLEKPWRIIVDAEGHASNKPELKTKLQFRMFRENKLREYDLLLSPPQMNAFTYVEGEGTDYSSKYRVMNELADFCHRMDNKSARGWHDYPKKFGEDEWTGAGRFRVFPDSVH